MRPSECPNCGPCTESRGQRSSGRPQFLGLLGPALSADWRISPNGSECTIVRLPGDTGRSARGASPATRRRRIVLTDIVSGRNATQRSRMPLFTVVTPASCPPRSPRTQPCAFCLPPSLSWPSPPSSWPSPRCRSPPRTRPIPLPRACSPPRSAGSTPRRRASCGTAASFAPDTPSAPSRRCRSGRVHRRGSLVGAHHRAQPDDDVIVQVRVREDSGWSDWETPGVTDEGPQSGTDESSRPASARTPSSPTARPRSRCGWTRRTASRCPTSGSRRSTPARRPPTTTSRPGARRLSLRRGHSNT